MPYAAVCAFVESVIGQGYFMRFDIPKWKA